MAGWLVVSDVDHTLIESPDQAVQAGACLRRLQRRGIATLLASSKTFSEMVALQETGGLAPQPFLFENGAGSGWPLDRWPAQAGAPPQLQLGAYGALVEDDGADMLAVLLRDLRAETGLRFALLSELSYAEIERHLGLAEPLARLALQRLASLPLLWREGQAGLDQLRWHLAPHGLTAVSGGRLLHISRPGGKGEALERLLPWLTAEAGATSPHLLACGDSENDRSLLERAAIALVFHQPDRPPLPLAAPSSGAVLLRRSIVAGGPEGWLEAVEAALAAQEPAQLMR
jgi:mannosyl-3-phosphoglycerate phosphatase family protein